MKEDTRVRTAFLAPVGRIIMLICGGLLFSGCVLSEKYEAEKARSLNFQRLLAQEEKRTGELDNEVKRTKRELTEYETRNRELTAQVQAVREQLARAQEETLACDLFLTLGSSLVVYPAAGFPVLAKRKGARLIILNREPTELDGHADLAIHGEIGPLLGAAAGVN